MPEFKKGDKIRCINDQWILQKTTSKYNLPSITHIYIVEETLPNHNVILHNLYNGQIEAEWAKSGQTERVSFPPCHFELVHSKIDDQNFNACPTSLESLLENPFTPIDLYNAETLNALDRKYIPLFEKGYIMYGKIGSRLLRFESGIIFVYIHNAETNFQSTINTAAHLVNQRKAHTSELIGNWAFVAVFAERMEDVVLNFRLSDKQMTLEEKLIYAKEQIELHTNPAHYSHIFASKCFTRDNAPNGKLDHVLRKKPHLGLPRATDETRFQIAKKITHFKHFN